MVNIDVPATVGAPLYLTRTLGIRAV